MFEVEPRKINGETKFIVRQVEPSTQYIGTADSYFRAQLLKARAGLAA